MKNKLIPIAKDAIFRACDKLSIPLYMVTSSMENKYLFFLIHKNGISTILSVLRKETLCETDESYIIFSKSKYKNHFKFCFIRNPWDRVVSCYTNKVVRKKLFHECWDKDFDYFVDYISRRNITIADKHIRLQTAQFPVKEVDYIAKFENFESEYNFIINEKLKLNRELVTINPSKHKHYSEFYNNHTRKIIETIYKSDINLGNYKFGK